MQKNYLLMKNTGEFSDKWPDRKSRRTRQKNNRGDRRRETIQLTVLKFFRSKCRKKEASNWLFRHYIYIWKTLKQSKSLIKDRQGERQKVLLSFIKSWLGASVPPRAKSDLWPTVPSTENQGYQKSNPVETIIKVCCLGQMHILLPE